MTCWARQYLPLHHLLPGMVITSLTVPLQNCLKKSQEFYNNYVMLYYIYIQFRGPDAKITIIRVHCVNNGTSLQYWPVLPLGRTFSVRLGRNIFNMAVILAEEGEGGDDRGGGGANVFLEMRKLPPPSVLSFKILWNCTLAKTIFMIVRHSLTITQAMHSVGAGWAKSTLLRFKYACLLARTI